MSAPFRATPGSADIADTGLPVPRGIQMRIFSLADSTGLGQQISSSAWDIPADLNQPANGADQPAGVGHNSRTQPMQEDESGKDATIAENQIRKDAWYTPSKQTLDEAAAANAGPGRHLHRQRALTAAIFDSRLGDTPMAVKLLAAVIDCSNSQTGTAFPGNERLALEIYIDLQRLPPEAREDALQRAVASVKNFATLLGQCGYMVTQRRAPPGGGRAVAHRAVTHPDREEMLAALDIHQRWQEQENARKADAKKRTDQGHAAHDLSYGNGARDLRTDGYGHAPHDLKAAEVTRRQKLRSRADTKNGPPHSILNPDLYLTPLSGADAPGGVGVEEEGFSGGAPDQGGAQPDSAPPSAKVGTCKPASSGTDDDVPPVALSPPAQAALDAYNAAAAVHGFTPCKQPTDVQAKRLEKRLKGIGGLGRFKRALSALPLDDWLMGRVKPKDGGKPFRLSLDRLLQTDGPRMGDVLGGLLGLADGRDAASGGAASTDLNLRPNWWHDPAKRKFAVKHESDDWWRRLIEKYCANGWNQEFAGPPPGDPGCLVSDRTKLSDLLGRFTRKKGTP